MCAHTDIQSYQKEPSPDITDTQIFKSTATLVLSYNNTSQFALRVLPITGQIWYLLTAAFKGSCEYSCAHEEHQKFLFTMFVMLSTVVNDMMQHSHKKF